MTVTKVFSCAAVAAIAVLNVSVATQAIASPHIVTRGPNGAGFISNKATPKTHSNTSNAVKTNQLLVTRGPNGAGFLTTQKEGIGGGQLRQESSQANYRVITRGPNGAAFLIKK